LIYLAAICARRVDFCRALVAAHSMLRADISRRDVLRGVGGTIAAAALPPLQTSNPIQRAIFLPGIMGSTLTLNTSTGSLRLWSKNAWDTYAALVDHPVDLKVGGARRSPDCEILDVADIVPRVPFCHVHYYGGILRLLR